MYRFSYCLLLLLSLLISGCPRLPEYALPHINTMGGDLDFSGKGFTYRALTVHDFRAQSPPEALSGHSKKIFAHSCIRIRLSKETRVNITYSYNDYFSQFFWSGNVQSIGFEAAMIPDCSWWNRNVPLEKRAYVLQHEQVHFALMELAARRLSRRVRKDFSSLFVIDSSRQGAEDQLKEKISAMIQEENKKILHAHTSFDEDCSLYFDPEKQQWWFDKVKNELRKTSTLQHSPDSGHK
ncbi:MAG TPA: hypothetical protein ENK96_07675 [Desulfobulbaceae bacterium]|nr:hypothetical protein [Desulfobulbaceae bacterium]